MSSVSRNPIPQRPGYSGDRATRGGCTGWFVNWVSDWGGLVLNAIMAIGDFSLFVFRTMVWLFTRLPRKETVWPNFYQVGVSSLPVVALTGTFIGMVLASRAIFNFASSAWKHDLAASST